MKNPITVLLLIAAVSVAAGKGDKRSAPSPAPAQAAGQAQPVPSASTDAVFGEHGGAESAAGGELGAEPSAPLKTDLVGLEEAVKRSEHRQGKVLVVASLGAFLTAACLVVGFLVYFLIRDLQGTVKALERRVQEVFGAMDRPSRSDPNAATEVRTNMSEIARSVRALEVWVSANPRTKAEESAPPRVDAGLGDAPQVATEANRGCPPSPDSWEQWAREKGLDIGRAEADPFATSHFKASQTGEFWLVSISSGGDAWLAPRTSLMANKSVASGYTAWFEVHFNGPGVVSVQSPAVLRRRGDRWELNQRGSLVVG